MGQPFREKPVEKSSHCEDTKTDSRELGQCSFCEMLNHSPDSVTKRIHGIPSCERSL